MRKIECPWCSNKVTTQQLGARERKRKPKWYQLTRHVQVCPHCNNTVKIDPKSIKWLWLIVPLFAVMTLRIIVGRDLLPVSPYNEIGFGLAAIGFLTTIFTMKLKKEIEL